MIPASNATTTANPYPGYDDIDNPPFLFDGQVDGRLTAKERVVGIGLDSQPTAVRLEPLLDSGVVQTDLDGRPGSCGPSVARIWRSRGRGSPTGSDVGQRRGVFFATNEGRRLTFERDGDQFVDSQTGSDWNVFGTAVRGALVGERLEAVEHVDTFWFAWAAFAPDTVVLP